jgi:hypothetical protein
LNSMSVFYIWELLFDKISWKPRVLLVCDVDTLLLVV